MSGADEPREPEGYDSAPPFRPAPRPPLLHRTVPVAREVPHYRLATVRLDLVAALTTGLAGEGIVLHVARMKTPVYERLADADVAT